MEEPENKQKQRLMYKYLSLVNNRTYAITVLCIAVTYLCIEYNFSYNIDLIIFSIAIIFPLVFTIREGFRRRQAAIRFLSMLKSSISSVYYCFENSNKLSKEEKSNIRSMLTNLSHNFIITLEQKKDLDIESIRKQVHEVYIFVDTNKEYVSGNTSLKLVKQMKSIQESIENLYGIKIHGTPVSLRAYCLVFIYVLPFIYTPTLVYNLQGLPSWTVYALSIFHAFILISLYNLQEDIEDPFDQVGLDDIKMTEFEFHPSEKFFPIPD